MKRGVSLFLFILAMWGILLAQSNQIAVNCNPGEMFVNSLSTSSFDPINSYSQPLLTSVTVNNLTQTAYKFNMHIIINWNNVEIINFTSKSTNLLHYGIPGIYTNRDLISSNSTLYFDEPEGEVSISHVLDTNNVLRDALQSGYFPDGTLQFRFIVTPDPDYLPGAASEEADFTITIRNINAIFLSYPGKPLGQTPPVVNVKPVTFVWNAVNTPQNRFRLHIKEFSQDTPPNVNNVENGGKSVYNEEVQGTIFTQFLPFQDKNYYAWRISTDIKNEYSSGSGNLQSEWYSFRYTASTALSESEISELMAILQALGNADINSTFAQGFITTGAIFYEGQIYTGRDALDLARALIGHDIEVEVSDN